jgi:hypothetical protein
MTTQTKEEAFALFERHRAEWLASARNFLNAHPIGTKLTVDDVRAACPPPEGIDGRVMGAAFKSLPWRVVGYRPSNRTTCHKRPIAVFERIR